MCALCTKISAKFEFFDPFQLPGYIPGGDFELFNAFFQDILTRQKVVDAELCEFGPQDRCRRVQKENAASSSCEDAYNQSSGNKNSTFEIPEVCAISTTTVARDANVTSSSVYRAGERLWGAHFLNDGLIWNDNINFFHSQKEPSPWARLSFSRFLTITHVVIFLRLDCCVDSFDHVQVRIGSNAGGKEVREVEKRCGEMFINDAAHATSKRTVRFPCGEPGIEGNYVHIQRTARPESDLAELHLNEVEVYTTEDKNV